MSDLSERLSARAGESAKPDEYTPKTEFDGVSGHIQTGGLEQPPTDFTALLEQFGYDPEEVRIVGHPRTSRWQAFDGRWLAAYRFQIAPKTFEMDLPALYQESRLKPRERVAGSTTDRTCVPVIADIQTGKVGSRGGTPELLDRLERTREKLAAELERRKPDSVFLPDINDLFENFESGGNPMFTNDLSLADQMDIAATEVYKFVELCVSFAPTTVAIVPSNHTAWRRGSQNLGIPGDDLGIFVHKQVEKVAKAAKLDATWHYPDAYNESLVVKVRDTNVGMVHGNQYRAGKAPEWWAKQTHGGQPVGTADILLTGHLHHLSILPTGRNPFTGRSKWWLQAPSLDNGSDWYRNAQGDDSDPGMLMFDVTDAGFDLQSLTVL